MGIRRRDFHSLMGGGFTKGCIQGRGKGGQRGSGRGFGLATLFLFLFFLAIA